MSSRNSANLWPNFTFSATLWRTHRTFWSSKTTGVVVTNFSRTCFCILCRGWYHLAYLTKLRITRLHYNWPQHLLVFTWYCITWSCISFRATPTTVSKTLLDPCIQCPLTSYYTPPLRLTKKLTCVECVHTILHHVIMHFLQGNAYNGFENVSCSSFGRSVRCNRYNLYRITLFCNKNKKPRTVHIALKP